MAQQTRLRLRRNGDRTEVLMLVKHAMESGTRVDQDTRLSVAADYIDRMTFALNGKPVAEARLGPGVAADPLTAIALERVEPGDRVSVVWSDSQCAAGQGEVVVD
jgi:thiosulfate oxidation carrier complex protein SoxZ